MAEIANTSPAGVYTNLITPAQVYVIDQSSSDQLLNTYTTDMALYDNNDFGTTSQYLSGQSIPNAITSTTYYKMRGFYIVGGVYEVYIVTGSPSLTPPSGHSLSNIAVIATWTV